MGLPGYLRGCFPVLPGWGVRCSRSYRERGTPNPPLPYRPGDRVETWKTAPAGRCKRRQTMKVVHSQDDAASSEATVVRLDGKTLQ